ILSADLFQVAIDLHRMFNVDVVHNAQEIDVHLGPPEHLESLHDLFVRRFLSLGHAVVIVELPRSVEAQTDIEILLRKELAPFLIDSRAIGLNTVDDLLAFRKVLFLKLYCLAEKIDAKQCRLAAMPGEADDFLWRRLDMLDDIAL